MNVKIVMYAPFPNGMACSRRIHNYAKVIKAAGATVEILIPHHTELDSGSAENREKQGTCDGVAFRYTCNPIRPGSFFHRRMNEIKGMAKAAQIVLCEKPRSDIIILVTNELRYILYYVAICRFANIRIIQEKSEYPFYNCFPRSFLGQIYQYLYKRYVYMLFDGIIAISDSLCDFFKGRIRKKAALIKVPIIVDTSEFTTQKRRTVNQTVVCCGTLTNQKEGVGILAKAFSDVASIHTDLNLLLVGNVDGNPDVVDAVNYLKERGLHDRVQLKQYVPREELIGILMNATVLALAKPKSLQSEHCFPSKLAEYLATGNPVVVTATGEIPTYLRDGENAFVAEPDSVESFTVKLRYVLEHPDISRQVGLRGKQLAEREFNYLRQGARLKIFFETLN